MSTSVK
jgi:Protein of unknown function (DUF2905)